MARRTAAQRRASMRNIRKAQAARRGGRRRSGRRRSRRSSRRNPGMPVVLVNPRRRKATRRRRRSSSPRRRRRRSTYVAGYRRRLPNPSESFGGSFASLGLGALGGGIAAGLDWGADYIPLSALWQSVILGGTGYTLSIGLAMLADTRLGAGLAGGTTALLVGRVRQQVALSGMAATNGAATNGGEAGAVARRRMRASEAGQVYAPPRLRGRSEVGAVVRSREAGAVLRREAGQMRPVTTPETMAMQRWPGARTFKRTEAGASYYTRGPIRYYGPQSWALRRETGAVYVSAHNR